MINKRTDPKAQEFAPFLEEQIKKLEASTSDERRKKIESTNDDFGNVLSLGWFKILIAIS